MTRRLPSSTLFPYTTLFRSSVSGSKLAEELFCSRAAIHRHVNTLRRLGAQIEGTATGYRILEPPDIVLGGAVEALLTPPDRKSTRLNSSHLGISYAVFCLKK